MLNNLVKVTILLKIKSYKGYRVCHLFRLTTRVAYFQIDFDHF